MTASQKSDFISKARGVATGFNGNIDSFNALLRQFDAQDLGNVLTDNDFKASNAEGITKQQFVDAFALIGGVLKSLPPGSSTVLFNITN